MTRFPKQLFLAALLAAGAVLFPAGCAASGGGEESLPAVKINAQEIPCSEFEAYLKASFGEDVPPAEDAETRSRLLDQFIEERLLLQLAEASKLRVDNAKVDAYIAGLGAGTDTGPGGKPVDAAFREQVRRNLLIEEYKNRVLLREVRVDPREAETYYREHPEEFREARTVVLRQILLEDAGEARQLLARLKASPDQFQVLAERHSLSPDHGQPRPYEEEDLPESIRTAVFALEPGQVSDIVEEGGKYRIFQAVDLREGKNQTFEEVRKKIEMLLLRRKIEESLAQAVAGLKRQALIRVYRKNLPFTYTGEYGG